MSISQDFAIGHGDNVPSLSWAIALDATGGQFELVVMPIGPSSAWHKALQCDGAGSWEVGLY